VSIYPLDDADEWRYTACSRLVEHGYAMFTQVFSAQPPLLFASLSAGLRLFGDSITGERWVEILFGLLCLASTLALAWWLSGPVSAGASVLLLSVSPLFLVYSRAIESEGPMMALTALSLALAVGYRRSRLSWLPVLSGLALAAAILFKLFGLEAVIPALWILWPPGDRRGGIAASGAFLAAATIPVAASFLLISPAAQWDQVVVMHQRAASAALPGLIPPLRILADLAGTDPGLVILAAAGLAVLAVLAVWEDLVFLLLWGGGTALMLLVFHPLFPHHAVILLPPLAVSAGVAVTVLVEQLRSRRWPAATPLAAAALVYVLLLPRLAHADRHVLIPGLPPIDAQVASFMASHASRGAIVASDNLAFPDLAGRLVPAPLCDLSNVRFRTGYASTAELVTATRKYHASLVVAAPGGIFSQAGGYLNWVRRHYRAVRSPDGVRIYTAAR
jgi:4-amino-4-deoxy-L-arabinose transferase-like glycosyltransferase